MAAADVHAGRQRASAVCPDLAQQYQSIWELAQTGRCCMKATVLLYAFGLILMQPVGPTDRHKLFGQDFVPSNC